MHEKNWLREQFNRTRLQKADLARYLVTDPAIVSRAISDPPAFSEFQWALARAFFSVVPADAPADLTDAIRRLRSPALRIRVVAALGQFLAGHGVQAVTDHPVDRCVQGRPLRADQICALTRVLGVNLADLTRSMAIEVRATLPAPKDRAEVLKRLEVETKRWSRGLGLSYQIDQGRAADSTAPRVADRETEASAAVRPELQQTRTVAFDDVASCFVVMNDALKPHFECGVILGVAWTQDAKHLGKWVVLFDDTMGSSVVGRVLAEHEGGVLLEEPNGIRRQVLRTPSMKIATIVATRLA